MQSTPPNGSLNYKGKSIALTFSENIQTNELNKQLIITPNSGNTYLAKTDGQNLILEFDKNLEENTTYALDFREGIADITERNKAENIRISFSTGDKLDSGKVEGVITNYLNEAPEKDITVALYPETDTSNIRNKAPYYFTKTDEAGNYSLQNIKPGKYWIFAHNDKNDNQYYDQQNEKIGYLPTPVEITEKPLKQDIKTVIIDTNKPYILSNQQYTDKNTIIYNEGIRELKFQTLENKPIEIKLITIIQDNGKNIDVYPTQGKLPDQVIALSIDSSFNKGIDTVKFSLTGKPGIPVKQIYKLKPESEILSPGEKIELEFPTPIQILTNQPFTITEDTIRQIKPTYPGTITLNESKTILTIDNKLTAKKSVEVKLDTTSIVGINGKPFNSTITKIPVEENNVKLGKGSLSGVIKTSFTNYTFELLNKNGKTIKTLQNPKTFSIKNLDPETYSIQVKIDENNNGKWEVGDKDLKKKPEKIYRYPKQLTVRANWDIEDLVLQF
jgi:uncharacterized protein (DUF2141 family)